jgi:hypothetical protein
VVVGNPCPTDWLGHTHSAVGLKCTLVGGIPRWNRHKRRRRAPYIPLPTRRTTNYRRPRCHCQTA